MTGVRPVHMPMLTKLWNRKVPAMPKQSSMLMVFRLRRPTWTQRRMMSSSRVMTAMQPSRPSSSPMAEKMKSVCWAGTAWLWVWGPL